MTTIHTPQINAAERGPGSASGRAHVFGATLRQQPCPISPASEPGAVGAPHRAEEGPPSACSATAQFETAYHYNPWSSPPWYHPSAEDEVVCFFRRKSGAVLNVNRSAIAIHNSASTVRQAFLRLERAGVVYCIPGREKWPGGPHDDDLWLLREYQPCYTVQISTMPAAIKAMSWLEVVSAVHPTLMALPASWTAAFEHPYGPRRGEPVEAGAEALRRLLTRGKARCDRNGQWAITVVPLPSQDGLTLTVTNTHSRR